MRNAANYLYNFGEIAERDALVRPLALTLAPGTEYERQVKSRFNALVDSGTGREISHVSDRYCLVQNRDVVTAVETVADTLGVRMERAGGKYRNGRTRLSWKFPDMEETMEGAKSAVVPYFDAGNDYGNGGSVMGNGWLGILICTNGMRRVEWQDTVRLRHVGQITVPVLIEAYGRIIQSILNKVDDQKQVVSLLASVDSNAAWVERILDSVRENRRPLMEDRIVSNVRTHGDNAWALAQAVTEAATHDFPSTWATDDWSAKQVDALIRDAELVVARR